MTDDLREDQLERILGAVETIDSVRTIHSRVERYRDDRRIADRVTGESG